MKEWAVGLWEMLVFCVKLVIAFILVAIALLVWAILYVPGVLASIGLGLLVHFYVHLSGLDWGLGMLTAVVYYYTLRFGYTHEWKLVTSIHQTAAGIVEYIAIGLF